MCAIPPSEKSKSRKPRGSIVSRPVLVSDPDAPVAPSKDGLRWLCPRPKKSTKPRGSIVSRPVLVSADPDGGSGKGAQAPLGQIVTNSETVDGRGFSGVPSSSPRPAPGNRSLERLGQRQVLADWARDDLAQALAGLRGVDVDDIARATLEAHNVIQRYVAALGYGEVRKRLGGAGKMSDDEIMGYEEGFGSVAMCGRYPIPSHGIDGEGRHYATGAAGAMEVWYRGGDEQLRGPSTIADFLRPPRKDAEKPRVGKRGMMRCNSAKCLSCTMYHAEEDAAALHWALMALLFQGASYAHMTLTLRHFHRDPVRQMDALRRIYNVFASCGAVKKLQKHYGFRPIFRRPEMTMDSLLSAHGTGAHPHYHILLSFPPSIQWGKSGGTRYYDVPTLADVEDIQGGLAEAWYDCISAYYGKEKEGWAAKHRENILRHGCKIQLYAVDDTLPDGEDAEKWAQDKANFDAAVKATRELWDAGAYPMPDQCVQHLDFIRATWRGNKDHFLKQLSGLSNVSRYVGATTKYEIYKEVTHSALKHGQKDGRVSYFAWLFQAAHAHDDAVDALAKNLLRAMHRMRFRIFSRDLKKLLRKDAFTLWDYSGARPYNAILTDAEAAEDAANTVPQYLPGDSVRIAVHTVNGNAENTENEGFDDIQAYGDDYLVQYVNDYIAHRIAGGEKVTADEAQWIWWQRVAGLRDESPVLAAGRPAPRIPAYIRRSDCWDFAPEALQRRPNTYKYQHILRLLRRHAPRAFRDLVREIVAGGVSLSAIAAARTAYDPAVEAAVLRAWTRDDLLVTRLMQDAHINRYLLSAMPDTAREQARAEKAAIRGILRVNGLRARDIDRYSGGYTDIWDDVYGTYAVYYAGFGGLDSRAKPIDGDRAISRAAVELGCPWLDGWVFGPPSPAFGHLERLRGWWGRGYNPAAFDLDHVERQLNILASSFDFLARPEYVDGREIWAHGRGEYARCVLIFNPGKLSVLLDQRRAELAAERDAALRAATDAALRDVQDTARRVGWRKKDIKEHDTAIRLYVRALLDGVSPDAVESSLAHCIYNHQMRKSRTRLISRMERDLLAGVAVYPGADAVVDWMLPRWSAADYALTGQYLEAVLVSPAPAASAVPQEILPGLAG